MNNEILEKLHAIEVLSKRRDAIVKEVFNKSSLVIEWLHALWSQHSGSPIRIVVDDYDDPYSFINEHGEIVYSIESEEYACSESFMHTFDDLTANFENTLESVRDEFHYLPRFFKKGGA